MRTLKFNRVHKNGWLSWKLAGVAGAVFIDKRMLSPETLANPPQTLDIDVPGMVEAGADATEAERIKAEKKAEKDAAKAAKATAAAEKAAARLAKLQENAAKAQAKAEAVAAKVAAGKPAGDQPTA